MTEDTTPTDMPNAVQGADPVRGVLAFLESTQRTNSRDLDDWRADVDMAAKALRAAIAAPPAPSQPAPSHADLIAALEFYASKEHMVLSDPSAWDTVSGEPQNWWCDEAGTATVEDGTIAAKTLAGKLTAEQIKAMDDGDEFPDDDEDAPSQPAPAQAVPLTTERIAQAWREANNESLSTGVVPHLALLQKLGITAAPQAAPVAMWCVHIEGPDDVIAAPDHATAHAACVILNGQFRRSGAMNDLGVNAVPTEWTHGYESWRAESDADFPAFRALFAAPVAQAERAGWREVMQRLITGIDHLSEIARQWEPDYSSGQDRRGWVLATDARDEAARLLAAPTPGQTKG